MSAAAIGALGDARCLVVKIGSALLVGDDGAVHGSWLGSVVDDVVTLRAGGRQVVLVSSGAIALGRRELGLGGRALRLDENQAAAAAGQIGLAQAWHEAFAARGVRVAQVLLTLGDTERRDRYLNARRTVATLLELDAVPVVNENDTVATDEIRYGDNDRLAARVAAMIGADALVLLSDVDGLYSADPGLNPDADHIARVERIDAAIEAFAGEARTPFGSGGMRTKVMAAKVATAAGCGVVLAGGRTPHPLRAIQQGARSTWFEPATTPLAARKQWIAGSLKPRGALHIDAGACAALAAGKSLLPAGVTAVDGQFGRGDTVRVLAPDGSELALGLCAYDSSESRRLAGRQSGHIEAVLGYAGRAELIHRDDLVLR